MKGLSSKLLSSIALLFFLGACKPSPQYQKNVPIPSSGWSSKFQPIFQVNIDDTASAYQLSFLIRHTNTYAFSNIWIRLGIKGPGEKEFTDKRYEVTLAEPPAVLTDGSQAGGWLGRGMGEIWEQRMPVNSIHNPLFFPQKGTYTLRLAQDMRIDPLMEILQVGLRLEKLGHRVQPK